MMNRALEFLETHPRIQTFLAGLLVAIATAIFNGLSRPRTPEEYDAMWPPFAKFCKIMRALGPVPQKLIEAMKPDIPAAVKRASLAPPAMPGPFSKVEKAIEGLGQIEIEVADSTPSTQPEGSTIPAPPKDPK